MKIYQVKCYVDFLDTKPEIFYFESFDLAHDFVGDEITRRMEMIVSHSQYKIDEEEYKNLEQNERLLVRMNIDYLTNYKLDYWLGDATNKQARINLLHECKHDPEVLNDVLNHWESR